MKTNTPTHNPIPWETHTVRTRGTGNRSIFEHCLVSGHRIIGKLLVANKNAREDAAFIVRAVNSHFELLDTLKGITKAFKKLSEKYEPDHIDAEWLAHAIEAIANAEGGK